MSAALPPATQPGSDYGNMPLAVSHNGGGALGGSAGGTGNSKVNATGKKIGKKLGNAGRFLFQHPGYSCNLLGVVISQLYGTDH